MHADNVYTIPYSNLGCPCTRALPIRCWRKNVGRTRASRDTYRTQAISRGDRTRRSHINPGSTRNRPLLPDAGDYQSTHEDGTGYRLFSPEEAYSSSVLGRHVSSFWTNASKRITKESYVGGLSALSPRSAVRRAPHRFPASLVHVAVRADEQVYMAYRILIVRGMLCPTSVLENTLVLGSTSGYIDCPLLSVRLH